MKVEGDTLTVPAGFTEIKAGIGSTDLSPDRRRSNSGSSGSPAYSRFVVGVSLLSYRRAMGRSGGYFALRPTMSRTTWPCEEPCNVWSLLRI